MEPKPIPSHSWGGILQLPSPQVGTAGQRAEPLTRTVLLIQERHPRHIPDCREWFPLDVGSEVFCSTRVWGDTWGPSFSHRLSPSPAAARGAHASL